VELDVPSQGMQIGGRRSRALASRKRGNVVGGAHFSLRIGSVAIYSRYSMVLFATNVKVCAMDVSNQGLLLREVSDSHSENRR
jgi:hypothetical protein